MRPLGVRDFWVHLGDHLKGFGAKFCWTTLQCELQRGYGAPELRQSECVDAESFVRLSLYADLAWISSASSVS